MRRLLFDLPAFRSRNYRLFFAGQGLSLIGSWITQTATIWLVYDLTQSAAMLGIVGFTSQIPSLLFLPLGGVLVDRISRHKTLIATQILSMVQSLALAALAFTGTIQIWQIIILSLFQGCINAVDAPARQAFVPSLIHRKDDLANAIALNSTMFNGARLIGPAVAGLLIARLGTSYCFLIDGLSYIAVIVGLKAMDIPPFYPHPTEESPLQRIKAGFIYSFGFAPIRAILILLALVSLFGMQYTVLVPIFATQILNGNAETLGFLMAASGMGALAGGIYLASRKTVLGLGKLIALSPILLGVGLILFAYSRNLPLSLFAMMVSGAGIILQVAASNTLLQTIVEDDKRGRVMSLYTMAFLGVIPVGNLLGGSLAQQIGAPLTLMIAGIICIVASIWFYRSLPTLRDLIRPVYQRLGVLSQSRPS